MKMVTAVIKHHRLEDVRKGLAALGVEGMTITEVKGFGRQKGHTEIYRGMEVEVRFLPKIKVELAVDASKTDSIIDAIIKTARTPGEGAIGDGKIFVYDLTNVVRIRTGETDKEAL